MMTEAGEYLGAAIAAVVNLVNPEFIVVDSPYKGVESFREGALREAEKLALRFPFSRTNILFIETEFSSSLGVAKAVILDYENLSVGP